MVHIDEQTTQAHCSYKLCVIGVTGTNGKTTVSHLLSKALNDAGYNAFALGTLNSGNHNLTTPLAKDIAISMERHLENGGTHFILEVSSEGIVEGRLDGIDFDIKILTNITPDHLDYHKTFEAYEQVKRDFMKEGDAYQVLPEDFYQIDIDFEPALIGEFNRRNIQASLMALRHLGILESSIQHSLASATLPKGRLEPVKGNQPFCVFIDYAHTPDALENVLSALQKITQSRGSRLLTLFGCGGDRDKSKRPQMGAIGATYSDILILTDDNPRFENGQVIIDEIIGGIDSDFSDYRVIRDRAVAIHSIIRQAHEHDIVVIAGKGHEQYQIINDDKFFFDDHAQASATVAKLFGEPTDAPLTTC
jgi:UDP-N-acetylmuramoyl-L-alanyl-D-glutamate--2,6-diaminopimelate ligase